MQLINLTSANLLRAVRLLLIASFCLGYAGCASFYNGDRLHGFVDDKSVMSQIKPGMRDSEVLAALGTPTYASLVRSQTWYYYSQDTRRPMAFFTPTVTRQSVIALYFDPNKTLKKIAVINDPNKYNFTYEQSTEAQARHESPWLSNIIENSGS